MWARTQRMKKKYFPEAPKAPTEKLVDPHSKVNITKVNTSFYLGNIADRCAKLGIYQNMHPLPYRNAVEQLEIFAIGSEMLGKDYFDAKEGLDQWKKNQLKKELKDYNPNIRKSKSNFLAQKKSTDIELEYDRKHHKLLMKHLAKSFWEFTREDHT